MLGKLECEVELNAKSSQQQPTAGALSSALSSALSVRLRGVNMDLKSLITAWEGRGALKRVTHPVSRDLEITEIYRRVFRDKGPALLFENVKDSRYPLLINMFGTWERVWDMFGVASEKELIGRIEPLLSMEQPTGLLDKARTLWKLKDLAGILPKSVKKGPCQRHVLEGPDIDLDSFPVMKCWP
jgi:4-hydroxy-3-polyprenylbenzoate decarboxylase